MLPMVIALVVIALVGLWIVALVDVVGAARMDQTSRLILAAVLLFAAPIGVLVWMVVRGGRVGAIAAATFAAVAVFAVVSVVAVATAHPRIQTVQVTRGGSASGAFHPIP